MIKRYECFPGWHKLAEETDVRLEEQAEMDDVFTNIGQQLFAYFKVFQGQLRVDALPDSSGMSAIFEEAREKRKTICELCGAPVILQKFNGWTVTRCGDCLNSRNVDKGE